MTTAYIALGANLGSPQATFDAACRILAASAPVKRRSRLYHTKPYGYTEQPDFINAAIEVETALGHIELIQLLQEIEARLGKKAIAPNGPRALDLDLIFFGGLIDDNPRFTIPHPRAAQRDFVLLPLCDINPGLIHPTLHKTIAQLLNCLTEHYFDGTVSEWR